MRLVLISILALVSSCFSCAHNPRKTNTQNSTIYQSVGRLSSISKDGKGGIFATGFAISDTRIMTVAHFCVAAYEGNIKGQLEEKINIQFVYNNRLIELNQILSIEIMEEKTDVCILTGNPGLVPVEFSNYSKVRIGDRISVVGSPMALFPSRTDGYVSNTKFSTEEGKELLFASVHISTGNSGSPVFDSDGRVVGMVVMEIVPQIFLIVDSPFCLAQRSDVLKRFARMVEIEN